MGKSGSSAGLETWDMEGLDKGEPGSCAGFNKQHSQELDGTEKVKIKQQGPQPG